MGKKGSLGIVFLFMTAFLIFGVRAFALSGENLVEQYKNSFAYDSGDLVLDKGWLPSELKNSEVWLRSDDVVTRIDFNDFRIDSGYDKNSLEKAAMEFLNNYQGVLGIKPENLEIANSYAGNKFYSASPEPAPSVSPSASATISGSSVSSAYPSDLMGSVFLREFVIEEGKKIYVKNGYVNLVFKKGSDGAQRIISYTSNYYNPEDAINSVGLIGKENAVESAKIQLAKIDERYLGLEAGKTEEIYYPFENRLVRAYSILFKERNIEGKEKLRVFVDAGFGKILNFYDTLLEGDYKGNVKGSFYEKNEEYEYEEGEHAFKDNYIGIIGKPKALVGVIQGTEEIVKTDSNGDYSFSTKFENMLDYYIKAGLSGPWAIVIDVAKGGGFVMERRISEGTDINWKNYDASTKYGQSKLFYYVNLAHDFARQEHINAPMDFQTLAKMNVDCDSVACYDSEEKSVNMCKNIDPYIPAWIIMHEYGHSIVQEIVANDGYYGGERLAINEGVAEYTYCAMYNWLGSPADDCFRESKYPEDYFNMLDTDPEHAGIWIIVGLLWDMQEKLKKLDGGKKLAESLSYGALRFHPGDMPDYVRDILLLDDDNGNIKDGTPHMGEICGAASKHLLLMDVCEMVSEAPIAKILTPEVDRKSGYTEPQGFINDKTQDITGTAVPAYGTTLKYWNLELIDLDSPDSAPVISVKGNEPVIKGIFVNNFDFSKLTTGHKYKLKLDVVSGDNELSSSAQLIFVKSNKLTIRLTERKNTGISSGGVYKVYVKGTPKISTYSENFLGAHLMDYSSCGESEGVCVHEFPIEVLNDEGDLIFNFLYKEKKDDANFELTRYLFLKRYSGQETIELDFNDAIEMKSNLQDILDKRGLFIRESNLKVYDSSSFLNENEWPWIFKIEENWKIKDSVPVHFDFDENLFFNDYMITSSFLGQNREYSRIIQLLDIQKYPFSSGINFDESQLNTAYVSFSNPFKPSVYSRISSKIFYPFSSYSLLLGSIWNKDYMLEFFSKAGDFDVMYSFSGLTSDSNNEPYDIHQSFDYDSQDGKIKNFLFFKEPIALGIKTGEEWKGRIWGDLFNGDNEKLEYTGDIGNVKITLPNGNIEEIKGDNWHHTESISWVNANIFQIDCRADDSYPDALKDKAKFCQTGEYKLHWEFGIAEGQDIFADGRRLILDTTYKWDGIDFVILSSKSFVKDRELDFTRGDVNNDNWVDLSDAVFLLNYLFMGGAKPSCMDAADFDDSGVLDLSDAVYHLRYFFMDGEKLPYPFQDENGELEIGADKTDDGLGCRCYVEGC